MFAHFWKCLFAKKILKSDWYVSDFWSILMLLSLCCVIISFGISVFASSTFVYSPAGQFPLSSIITCHVSQTQVLTCSQYNTIPLQHILQYWFRKSTLFLLEIFENFRNSLEKTRKYFENFRKFSFSSFCSFCYNYYMTKQSFIKLHHAPN